MLTLPAVHSKICFKSLLDILGKREITSILIEGGSEINASALAAGIVDKVMCFIAPKLIGGQNAPGPIGGVGICSLSEAENLRRVSITSIPGHNLLIEGYL